MRFEVDRGEGFERIFPETFSFHVGRHDPTELFLQLDDLLRKPRLLHPAANRRDARELVRRLLSAAPVYLDRICAERDADAHLDDPTRFRFHQDVALLAQLLVRFAESAEIEPSRPIRMAGHVLRRRMFRSLEVLMRGRVSPEYLLRYVARQVDPVDPSDDPTESGFFHALEAGDRELVERMIVRMAERAFYQWVEGVCLDEENQAFEKEDSPFADRESEILAAITSGDARTIRRGADITPFLRRGDRDCLRLLKKLEHWFLRQYDIRHSSALIQHAACLERGVDDGASMLTWHTPRNYVLALATLGLPFAGAAVAYERAPRVFDLVCSLDVAFVMALSIWFLLYRFCWKRDLSFFHASVPRIAAGIIVGYAPVFLIDEVWALAGRDLFTLGSLVTFLGLVTLLYIYVEVRRRLGDSPVAFVRARAIFLLGVLQAASVGLVMTSLVGPFMVVRSWEPNGDGHVTLDALAAQLAPFVGELPRIVGVEPFHSFPSALLLMTFLSFFIGVFLQLMWEELPITEPL
ncbi:MAG TPA: hypothetical protein VJP77_03330 [Planctomycetota bacterium]|nr:hypothetical protein [Planctomycetota bacterium]